MHSESARALVAPLYRVAPERLQVVPLGHYQSIYAAPPPQAEARAALGLPPGTSRVVLFFGFVRPYKGVEDLVHAWRQLEGEPCLKSSCLIITGKTISDAFAASLRRLTESTQSIRLELGYVDPALVPVYFGACDVVALPFRTILSSSSLLLALGFGRIPVAPRLPMVEEVLGPCPGILYPPDSHPAGLADALRRALTSDPDQWQAKALRRAKAFDWPAIGQSMALIYHQSQKCN